MRTADPGDRTKLKRKVLELEDRIKVLERVVEELRKDAYRLPDGPVVPEDFWPNGRPVPRNPDTWEPIQPKDFVPKGIRP